MPVTGRSRNTERWGGTSPLSGPFRARISVVIPAKNEARNIGWVLERLPVWVDEVVLVDGRSTDRTIEVARAIRPDIVVVQDDEPGKGAAIRAGIAAATGDFVVMLDADGSMDPSEIEAFVSLLYRGHDLVKGSRFLPGGGTADMSILRSAGNRALVVLGNLLFGVAYTDLCYGFAAFRRDRILSLELDAVGFEIETQLFLRATRQRLEVTESPSFEAPRRFGTSNLNTFRDGWRVLMTILGERLRPQGGLLAAVPIEAEPVAIPIEPGAYQVTSMVTDRAYLGPRAVPTPVETFVE
jgi:glycosyltransferase involved in cell wall biosynthesis